MHAEDGMRRRTEKPGFLRPTEFSGTTEALEVTLPDVPGTLGALARKLAKARVNIEAFYIVGAGADGLRCVVAVDKLEKAKATVMG